MARSHFLSVKKEQKMVKGGGGGGGAGGNASDYEHSEENRSV